jgi:ankyrin repeat protein
VRRLLDAGADVNHGYMRQGYIGANLEIGRTALHQACANQHPEIVELLLQRGAKPNVTDEVLRILP